MATSPRYPCLVLTLWIAVLCSSAAVRTGSPDSVWWGTKESAQPGEVLFDKRPGEALRSGVRAPPSHGARDEAAAQPVETQETLSRLKAKDPLPLPMGHRIIPVADRFRLRFTEMEAQTGLADSLNPPENFPSGDSLIHFQHGLRVFDVFPSLDLGERSLYL